MSIKIDDTPLTLEQVQAISDALHGRTQIRFDPDAIWTANKKLAFLQDIDAVMAAQADHVEIVHTLRQVCVVKG